MDNLLNKRVENILSDMSLKEKIGQLNQICAPMNVDEIESVKDRIRNGEVGSLIMASTATAGNDEQDEIDVELFNELQRVAVEETKNHIPLIFGRDVIHGHRTVYPIPLASAASFNPELVKKCYKNVAKEATNDGIHWTFAPMLDLCRDPRWGRIIEGPGEDPFVGKCLAEACVKGFQGEDLSDKDSLLACAKHYIGYGASEGGRDYFRTEISDISLYNYYLPAFRAAVDSGVGTVMSSFNDINGIPINGSNKYLKNILKNELGFDGFVVSDWNAVEQLEKQGAAENRAECAKKSIESGVDLDMVDGCYIENLENLYNENKISIDVIDDAVKRILRMKIKIGLFDNPYCKHKNIDRTKHIEDARKLACESMVLLKNNGVLPLEKGKNVILSGPFAKEKRSLLGSWTLDGRASETMSLYEAMNLHKSAGKVFCQHEEMSVLDNTNSFFNESDTVVLALGESNMATGEGRSVADISLDVAQLNLIKKVKLTGKKIIGICFCGRPVAMKELAENVDALIYAWHCGTETANAVCDLLFGDAVPCGKTPITFLRETGHIPLYYNTTSSGRYVNGYYGENSHYSYIDSISKPYYPFGYGLSYTTFCYSEPEISDKKITLEELKNGKKISVVTEISNTGDYDGKETVQLYICDVCASIMRPIKELKGFSKPLIKKGEKTKVEFKIDFDSLGYYNEKGEYVVEKGSFDIFVGPDSLTDNKATIIVE